MDQPPLLASNDQIEISAESINNNGYDYYSNGLLQQEDTFQQNPCSCNNCLSTASNNNFQIPYDNDNSNYMNISDSPPLMQQHTIIEQVEQNSSTSPSTSTNIKEQCINDQQFLDHLQPQSVPNITSPSPSLHNNDLNDLNINLSDSQMNYTELFRVEISGIEIIFRKKISLDLNHNLETRNQNHNEQSSPGIRAGRIQYRVHPYQIPAGENCRYNKFNYRNHINPNYIQKQYYYNHLTPQLNQHIQIIDSYQ